MTRTSIPSGYGYEDGETLDVSTTAADGKFTLTMPGDIAPYADTDTYYLTIVVKKTGWLTNYCTISCTDLEAHDFSGNFIALAPEGEGIKVTGRHTSLNVTGGVPNNDYIGLNPYTTFMVTVETWPSGSSKKYTYSPVSLYLNGSLIRSWNAPEYSGKPYWNVFYVRRGALYDINSTSGSQTPSVLGDDEYINHGMLYPSCMK